MPDSRKLIFGSAAVGNVAPVLLKWYADARISMPGETLGGLLAYIIFALLSGFVATFVWKERTAKRAFVVGLTLPYLIWGGGADVLDAIRLHRAHGQPPTQSEVGAYDSGPYGGALLKLNVAGEEGPPPPKYSVRLATEKGDAVLKFENRDKILALPGTYRLTVGAPGYRPITQQVTLSPSQATEVSLRLSKASFMDGVWEGFKFTLFASPTRTNAREPTWDDPSGWRRK
jgi:PEGA domain-containing protein